MRPLFQTLALLRKIFHSSSPSTRFLPSHPSAPMDADASTPPAGGRRGDRPIRVAAIIPADRLSAVEAELNFSLQHILERAARESDGSDPSTLLALGFRVHDPRRDPTGTHLLH